MRSLFLFGFFLAFSSFVQAQGDTTWVQTFTFETQNNPNTDYDSPVRQWFPMPADDGTTYQKILMYYTLKCFEDGTAGGLGFPCGEWDYLTYTNIHNPTGVMDSTFTPYWEYLLANETFDTVELQTALVAGQAVVFNTLEAQYINYEFDISGGLEDYELSAPSAPLVAEELEVMSKVRSQFLYRADEIAASGFVETAFSQMSLNLASPLLSECILTIKVAETEDSLLTDFISEEDITQIWQGPWSGEAGWSDFQVPINDFEWDGTSSLVFEFSIDSPLEIPMEWLGEQTNYPSALYAAGKDQHTVFGPNDEVVLPASVFETVQDEITIAFWQYGDPDLLPANTYCFEGVNASGQRIVNAHVPWSNSRVYWDAGNLNGNYDRIDKAANANNFSGQWNHWTFTKNAVSGEMKVYLNGDLWHSGSNKFNSMEGIVDFSIGKGVNSPSGFLGAIDDFRIWNAELDGASIEAFMNRDLADEDAFASNLLVDIDFESEYGTEVTNNAPNGIHGSPLGSYELQQLESDVFFKNLNSYNERPAIRLSTGGGESLPVATIVETLEPVPPLFLSQYATQGNSQVLLSSTPVYTQDHVYHIDYNGIVVDSTSFDSLTVTGIDSGGNEIILYGFEEEQVINQELFYYAPPFEVVDRYEIGRFITPYGINLDMGEEGWTWVYDVTDFAPLLKDSIDLSAGNWQELLDLKFAFIEGTPPRDVQRIENMWNGNYQLSSFEADVPDKMFYPQVGEEQFRLKTATSGHWFGQGNNCAEFCNNIHSIEVSDNVVYSWQIMQECSDNPLFPQGGTWIYDRAGWCPGDKVTIKDWDMTPYLLGQDSVLVDYDCQYDPYGNYILESQMITYGPTNMQYDVAVEQILAPNKEKIYSRTNPMCREPEVMIKNYGSETITSLLFTFGAEDDEQTFEWTGELGFLDSEVVALPYDNQLLWTGVEEELMSFTVNVSQPNGNADEQPSNNTGRSEFIKPPVYDFEEENELIIMLRTNDSPFQSKYTLYDENGDVVFARDDFSEANETHRDTLGLGTGCYTLHVEDSAQNGLSFFANSDGNGYARLKQAGGSTLITLENDFGKEIFYSFVFKTLLTNVEEVKTEALNIDVSPVPSNGWFDIQLSGEPAGRKLDYQVVGSNGAIIKSGVWNYGSAKAIDLRNEADGIYHLRIMDRDQVWSTRLVKAG